MNAPKRGPAPLNPVQFAVKITDSSVNKERVVKGPFYHGGRNITGGMVETGQKTNCAWGDEGSLSKYVHFSPDRDVAETYAQGLVGEEGHVYEVEPTGEVEPGYQDNEYKSKSPLRIRNRLGSPAYRHLGS